MRPPRIGAVVVAQNEAETIEKSIASYYDYVEAIVVSTDPTRGWSGTPVTQDDTLDLVRAMDRDHKIEVLRGDFCRYEDPMRNDTYQRQITAQKLSDAHPGLDWVVQVDADEEFLDFRDVIGTLGRLPPWTRGVYWRWIQLFNRLDDGRFLVIVDGAGNPVLEPFPLAHRPNATLSGSRHVQQPIPQSLVRRLTLLEFRILSRHTRAPVLHYSYAKSEVRIQEKLQTWSHTNDFDTHAFFDLWKRSGTDWETLRDFHPTYPIAWPALKPFHLDALRALFAER